MTKLEEKLVELGYEFYINNWGISRYQKILNEKYVLTIIYDGRFNRICGMPSIAVKENIEYQQDIDNLQQVFNVLQKDLEVLREYERLD